MSAVSSDFINSTPIGFCSALPIIGDVISYVADLHIHARLEEIKKANALHTLEHYRNFAHLCEGQVVSGMIRSCLELILSVSSIVFGILPFLGIVLGALGFLSLMYTGQRFSDMDYARLKIEKE